MPQNVVKISEEELLKAACCNLSESFETNPSIDVNFSDALTGTKQIKMLGLSSPYILISEENIPSVRGASQIYGLTYTPGTWIESIQITKGAGSVTNGFESIAGQINTELKKPFFDFPLYVNLYSSVNGRQEANLHWNKKISEKWSTGLYLHGNQRTQKFDRNKDGFIDIPLAKQTNLFHRWQYTDAVKGWVGFLGLRYLNDEKQSVGVVIVEHEDALNHDELVRDQMIRLIFKDQFHYGIRRRISAEKTTREGVTAQRILLGRHIYWY